MAIHHQITQPISGVGVGLRSKHIPFVLDRSPAIPWFELLADNWLAPGGLIDSQLHVICESYPITLHRVGLSLGSIDPLNTEYLSQIKGLIKKSKASWYSEHACFTRHAGVEFHDLCPLPGTEEAVFHLANRIDQVQNFLGTQILLENVSSYVCFEES